MVNEYVIRRLAFHVLHDEKGVLVAIIILFKIVEANDKRMIEFEKSNGFMFQAFD